jgi:hypothetical protein
MLSRRSHAYVPGLLITHPRTTCRPCEVAGVDGVDVCKGVGDFDAENDANRVIVVVGLTFVVMLATSFVALVAYSKLVKEPRLQRAREAAQAVVDATTTRTSAAPASAPGARANENQNHWQDLTSLAELTTDGDDGDQQLLVHMDDIVVQMGSAIVAPRDTANSEVSAPVKDASSAGEARNAAT